MNKVSMRKIFMAIVISVMACTVGATNQNHSQNSDIRKFSKTFLVKEKKVKFTVQADIEYPADCPELEKLMIRKMFGSETTSIDTALKEYIGKFESAEEPANEGEKREYNHGYVKFTAQVLGKHNKANIFDRLRLPESFCQLADRYMSILCNVATMTNMQMKEAGINQQAMSYMFTYDKEEGRLLNVNDVFTKEAMRKLGISDSTENTEVMVRPYTNTVAFSTAVNGKKANMEVTLNKNASSFTDRIKVFVPYMDDLLQEIEIQSENERKDKLKQKWAMEKVLYQKSNTDMKELYLYLWYDTCYVSGIHKDIMTLTDEEIDQLAKPKKCSYIKQEILEARKYMKTSPSPGKIAMDDDPEKSYIMNGDAYPEGQCDTEALAEKPMTELGKKGKRYYGIEGDTWQAIYIVDSTGCVTMPIVIIDRDLSESKLAPEKDRMYTAKLRKLKYIRPAKRNGRSVRSIQGSSLVTHVLYNFSNINSRYYIPRRYRPRR